MELDLQVSPDVIMSWEVELGCESWTSFASSCSSTAVQHCPCDSAQARKLKQQLRSALSHWAMARGHRRNTSIVLAAIHGLSGLFRAVSANEPSLLRPLPPVPVPNKPPRFCGRKAKWSDFNTITCDKSRATVSLLEPSRE